MPTGQSLMSRGMNYCVDELESSSSEAANGEETIPNRNYILWCWWHLLDLLHLTRAMCETLRRPSLTMNCTVQCSNKHWRHLLLTGLGTPVAASAFPHSPPFPRQKYTPFSHDYRLAVEPLLISPMVRRLTSESANKASMSSITSSAENSSPSSPSVQRYRMSARVLSRMLARN